jgi:putative FmdB family regulatory protein
MIFDYKCVVCNHMQEKFVKSSTEVVLCPRCDAPMQKLVSSANVKVTGFSYVNGYSKPKED